MAFASLVGIKRLLVATAAMELGAGLAPVVLPSPVATVLLGSSLDAPVPATVGRVAGMALVLAHGGMRLGLTGIALWPTALLHTVMGGWCLVVWRRPRSVLESRVRVTAIRRIGWRHDVEAGAVTSLAAPRPKLLPLGFRKR
jgi:hypothetical protein